MWSDRIIKDEPATRQNVSPPRTNRPETGRHYYFCGPHSGSLVYIFTLWDVLRYSSTLRLHTKFVGKKKNPETETNKTLVVAGEISGGRRCRTRSAPTASGARRSSSTTPPATPSAPSAASSSRLTPSTRPPSGEPSPTSRATTTPSVSAGPPTRCSPTAASPQWSRSRMGPREISSHRRSAAGRAEARVPTVRWSSRSGLSLQWPIGLFPSRFLVDVSRLFGDLPKFGWNW